MMYKSGMKRASGVLLLATFLVVQAAAFADQRTAESDYRLLVEKKNSLPPEVRENLELFHSLLQNYYSHPDQLSETELDLVTGALSAAGIQTAAGRGKHVDLTKTMVGTKKAVRFRTVVNQIKDKSVGKLYMHVPDKVQDIVVVEVERPLPTRVVQTQMETILQRVSSLVKAEPNWWMQLDVTRHPKNGEVIVHHPKSPDDGIVVTADTAFAKLSGMKPAQLAEKLLKDIKAGIGGAPGGRSGTPRDEAMKLRSEGDDQFEKDRTGAKAKYLQALHTDPSYPHAYERLAQIAEIEHHADVAEKLRNRIVVVRDLENIRQSTEDPQARIAAYRERLDTDPGAIYPYFLLIREYRQLSQTDELDTLAARIKSEKELDEADRKYLLKVIELG